MSIYEHLEVLLPQGQHLRIVEIGAADGQDTARLFATCKRKAQKVDFWCFEPDPRNFSRLHGRLGSLPVRVFNLAVGAQNGMAELFLSSGVSPWSGGEHTLSSSIRTPQDHLIHFPWCTFPESTRVEVVTLDSFFAPRFPKIDFIWCDAQGAEGDIIAGGQRLLARTRYFYFESSESDGLYEGQATREELLEKLDGWKVIEEYANDVLVENSSWLDQNSDS